MEVPCNRNNASPNQHRLSKKSMDYFLFSFSQLDSSDPPKILQVTVIGLYYPPEICSKTLLMKTTHI